MKLAPLPFADPFDRNHCVPIAFAVAGPHPSAKFALGLAEAAYWRVDHRGVPLLRRNGRAPSAPARVEEWARLAGLVVVQSFRPSYDVVEEFAGGQLRYRRIGRPTIRQFERGVGRRGRWIVFTNGHAQAIINGKVRGWYSARSRVRSAFRVEEVS